MWEGGGHMSLALACSGRPGKTSWSRGAPRAAAAADGGVMSRSRQEGDVNVVEAVVDRTYLIVMT
jgi:hypothetical protein